MKSDADDRLGFVVSPFVPHELWAGCLVWPVIIASSDPIDLVECCDRVLCLRKGVVVKELVGEEITEEAIVRAIMIADRPAEGGVRAA